MSCVNSSASASVSRITGDLSQQLSQAQNGVASWTIPKGGWGGIGMTGGRRRKSPRKKYQTQKRSVKQSRRNRNKRSKRMRR